MFRSEFDVVGRLDLPPFTGVRIMMLPFRLDDPDTLPGALVGPWRPAVGRLVDLGPMKTGIGYLTIDEAEVAAGEHHRRPGLHVDGVGPEGGASTHPGGGHSSGGCGMLIVSSHVGCSVYRGTIDGWPGPNGDCAHLADQCKDGESMQPGVVYACNRLTVHESLTMRETTKRQFCRLSMPNDAPWYDGYTRNPLGVEPTGPIKPRRVVEMAWRS